MIGLPFFFRWDKGIVIMFKKQECRKIHIEIYMDKMALHLGFKKRIWKCE